MALPAQWSTHFYDVIRIVPCARKTPVLLKMAVRYGLVVLLAIVSFGFVSAASKRTLVLLDNWTIRETHSIFFRTLRGKKNVSRCTYALVQVIIPWFGSKMLYYILLQLYNIFGLDHAKRRRTRITRRSSQNSSFDGVAPMQWACCLRCMPVIGCCYLLHCPMERRSVATPTHPYAHNTHRRVVIITENF